MVKFKDKNKKSVKNISAPVVYPKISEAGSTNDLYPAFCFNRNTVKGMRVVDIESKHRLLFLDRIFTLSKMTWGEIQLKSREKMGYEKIPVKRLMEKLDLPQEQQEVQVFRFGVGRIIGYRQNQVFYICAIDTKFICYKH